MLGFSLVIGSLGVLLVLFGQLVYAGGSRLFQGHDVKLDGFSPKNSEIVGVLSRESESDAEPWILGQEPYRMVNATDILDEAKLELLSTKPVLITADLPVKRCVK